MIGTICFACVISQAFALDELPEDCINDIGDVFKKYRDPAVEKA